MGLAANPIPAVALLLSLLTAATTPPVSAKLKTFTITYDDFYSNTQKLRFIGNDSSPGKGALQLTVDEVNSTPPSTNNSGRVLYHRSFKLWEGQNYSDRVASFSTSFLVNLNRENSLTTPGEGLTFVVAPDHNLPPNSFGGYLGLTNATTDGHASNQIIAIELDTFQESWDPDANHVGLNINSVISNKTSSLIPELVSRNATDNYFNLWIEYDGIKKVINQSNFIPKQSKHIEQQQRRGGMVSLSPPRLIDKVARNLHFSSIPSPPLPLQIIPSSMNSADLINEIHLENHLSFLINIPKISNSYNPYQDLAFAANWDGAIAGAAR
ncbi:hypothetical protein RHSIM_Rhsim10G0189300 [Rhododendron simsii]|uniref:Legume lectin domain-containing protein n=1 Tax=Rhododendron simsii TaxID=118357 RepID=A0A834GBS4_RHOSS|nr:hypothetical protein RHSIM_Rhsim10G0189300 [Rhododendron simsii]